VFLLVKNGFLKKARNEQAEGRKIPRLALSGSEVEKEELWKTENEEPQPFKLR
jgi:hypothetical protein